MRGPFRSVALTGHRRDGISHADRPWVVDTLGHVAARLGERYGAREAISGMAVGADTWWAQAALEHGLSLAAYLPCPQQADRWATVDRETWTSLRSCASREWVASDHYTLQSLHSRNARMVDDCDALVAVLDPARSTGGTASTVRRARAKGLDTLHVDPIARTLRWMT